MTVPLSFGRLIALSVLTFAAAAVTATSEATSCADSYNSSNHSKRSCAPAAKPGPPSLSFCEKPPVVEDLDVSAYGNGTWYQLASSGSALEFGTDRCTTANYTLGSDGNVAVLNCGINEGDSKPGCIEGEASPREGGTKAAELTVAFPTVPTSIANPASYSVAAVLGEASSGYLAAAVYQCLVVPGGETTLPGFFIIGRHPFPNGQKRENVLTEIKQKLQCSGYDVDVNFVQAPQDEDCTYFFEEGGFDIRSGPPPGVDTSGAGPPPGVV